MLPNRETLLCSYRYDPLDRLVDCTPSAQPPTRRFYLKDRLATEIQGAVQRSIMQHDDQLLAQQQRQSGAVEAHLLATDQQRSVLNVLDVARPHPLAYSPYGHRPEGNGLLSLLGFNGERRDPMTGCYLLGNGYRAFNPVLMRFNSPDSWSPFGEGGLNAYGYCFGDPINSSDPSGHLGSMWSLVKKNISKIVTIPKNAGTLNNPSKPTIEAEIQITHTKPATEMGLFSKFQNMPDITQQIFQDLPGTDLVSLASTSKAIKRIVYDSSKPISKLLSTVAERSNLNSAAKGEVKGFLPADVIPIRQFEKTMEELLVRHHDLDSRFGSRLQFRKWTGTTKR
jgi:RHS repeat-associated protein